MKKEHLNWLKANNAYYESIEWVEENKISSLEEAWNLCERGDWLLWMASRLGVDKRKLTLCGALCAHTVVQYMEDSRSRNAVRVAFLYGRGKATLEELKEARIHAWAAYADAAYADAADEKENQRKTAEIARKILTEDVMKKIEVVLQ